MIVITTDMCDMPKNCRECHKHQLVPHLDELRCTLFKEGDVDYMQYKWCGPNAHSRRPAWCPLLEVLK